MISISYRDSRPLYEQVKEELRRLMISGVLEQGDKLPSVRELAVELTVNPNTVQRAYRELEAEGYIVSVPGKGSFAYRESEAVRARCENLKAQMKELADELRALGVSDEEIIECLELGVRS